MKIYKYKNIRLSNLFFKDQKWSITITSTSKSTKSHITLRYLEIWHQRILTTSRYNELKFYMAK